jgi:hypothetical protein
MTLLLQIIGACAAVLTVVALTGDGRPLSRAAAAPIAIAAIAAAIAWQPAYTVARDAWRGGNAPKAEPEAAFAAGGRAGSLDVDRINWLANRIPRRSTFAMVPELPPNSFEYQWLTYQLTPRRLTDPDKAEYLVFYRQPPSRKVYDRLAFGRPELLAPDFGVAKRRDAR